MSVRVVNAKPKLVGFLVHFLDRHVVLFAGLNCAQIIGRIHGAVWLVQADWMGVVVNNLQNWPKKDRFAAVLDNYLGNLRTGWRIVKTERRVSRRFIYYRHTWVILCHLNEWDVSHKLLRYKWIKHTIPFVLPLSSPLNGNGKNLTSDLLTGISWMAFGSLSTLTLIVMFSWIVWSLKGLT